MNTILKGFLIKLLFRLIDVSTEPLDTDKNIKRWLAGNWQDKGFQEYIKRRDRRFLIELAGGMGMVEKKHDDYVRIIGQRWELLRFADYCKRTFEDTQKK